ncbi:MAG: hypothetical protein AB4372_04700 [Xenococcus sp. (in: cyanobacteria)]
MKRTRKYVAAEKTALEIVLELNDDIYQNLQENNYFWDSEEGEWIEGEAAHPPTKLIKIRVWADSKTIKQDCDLIIHSLASNGFVLEEGSQPYICRPPKQLESRIYLTFSREN